MMRKWMVMLVILVFACASLFVMTSCAKKQVQVEEPAPVKPAEVTKEAPKADTGKPAPGKPGEDPAAEAAKKKLQAEMEVFENEHIYFDFDKSDLKPEARAILEKKADWLRKNPGYSVRIGGHCDERGTNEYNLALGERRANAASKFLNAVGIASSRLSTISYGEEKPADPRHHEVAWSKNRRDEFKLSGK